MGKKYLFAYCLIVLFLVFTAISSTVLCAFATDRNGKIGYEQLDYNCYEVLFIDETHGFISGKAGSFFCTDDGGKTWLKKQTGTKDSIFSLSFLNKDKGWAVGQCGLILATEDGGKSWTRQKAPLENHFFAVKFTDELHGVACGDWGKIILTEDGGKTWVDVSLEDDIMLYCIDFIDKNEGCIGSEMGFIYHTTDGGKTWEMQDVGLGRTFFGIAFDPQNKGSGLAVGMEGVAVSTEDGGKTWEELPGIGASVFNVSFFNETALAVGESASIFASDTKGRKWKQIDAPLSMKHIWYQGVSRISENKYLIAGAVGSLLFIKNFDVVKRNSR